MLLRTKMIFYYGLIILLFILLFERVPVKKEVSAPSGFIGYGLYNSEGELVDNGDSIDQNSCSNEFSLFLSQDLNESREYLVLVFIDYIQTSFITNDNQIMQKEICLQPSDKVNVPLEINMPSEAKELSILIIKQPNFMVDKDDFDRAIKTEDIITLRFPVAQSNVPLVYSQNYEVSKEKPVTQVFISDDPDKLIIKTVENANSTLYLSLGNEKSEKMDYAIVALHNWKQIPLCGEFVNYYELPKQSHIYFNFKVPNVKEDSNYQIVTFPHPYKVDINNPKSSFTYSTHRLHIKP